MGRYNVLIIGAGRIGASFDTPASRNILTHAHAFKKNRNFNLLGFVDDDKCRAEKAARLWGCRAFQDMENAFGANRIDVACVAVPTDRHSEVLKEVVRFRPRLILAEKPFTGTPEEARRVIGMCRAKNIEIAVNYMRRFMPEFEKIRQHIKNGRYGRYLTGTGYYGKGLLNNGSHMVDLLRFLVGEISGVESSAGIADFDPDDESVSAILHLRNGRRFFLECLDSRIYTIFEMDLLFERKRIRIPDMGFGIEEYDVKDHGILKGYRSMTVTARKRTCLNRAFYHVTQNIYRHLFAGERIRCTAADAYNTMLICARIKKDAGNG